MAELLKGREISKTILEEIKVNANGLKAKGNHPSLTIIRVGKKDDDIAYERGIIKSCEKADVSCRVIELPETVTTEVFKETLESLNKCNKTHGILVFRPFPKHIDDYEIKSYINPDKDIDCMSPINLAKVFEGDDTGYAPCTPAAVMEIIKRYEIDLIGKKTVVIGRSMVVGKPLSMMLLKENATITICHSKTTDLKQVAQKADILIAAIGKAKYVTEDFVKEGAVVIDVGINIDDDGKLCGDVDFDNVQGKASLITPVPGGVGSVTTAILLKHVVKAADLISKK